MALASKKASRVVECALSRSGSYRGWAGGASHHKGQASSDGADRDRLKEIERRLARIEALLEAKLG